MKYMKNKETVTYPSHISCMKQSRYVVEFLPEIWEKIYNWKTAASSNFHLLCQG